MSNLATHEAEQAALTAEHERLRAKLAAPIVMSLHVDTEDAIVIRDALAMYRSPIADNMAIRDCLLELVQEKIDQAAAREDLPEDWLAQQHAAIAAGL